MSERPTVRRAERRRPFAWWGSNYGRQLDLIAPGVQIWTSIQVRSCERDELPHSAAIPVTAKRLNTESSLEDSISAGRKTMARSCLSGSVSTTC